MSETDERIDELFERAREKLELIATKADEDELGPVLSHLDDLEDVADEAEDILSTADLAELVGAIDWGKLPEAVELEDLPEAIGEGDAAETVSPRKLVELVDLPALWESVDARELWREKREFDEELDDVTDDGGSDGRAGDASMPDVGAHEFDPESVENAIQSEIGDSVEEFREKLLDAHDRLEALRERNEERFPDRRRKRSRNPTAVSTLPKGRSPVGSGTRYSTVPQETRYSTAPNHRRIYGSRFETARGDGDE